MKTVKTVQAQIEVVDNFNISLNLGFHNFQKRKIAEEIGLQMMKDGDIDFRWEKDPLRNIIRYIGKASVVGDKKEE